LRLLIAVTRETTQSTLLRQSAFYKAVFYLQSRFLLAWTLKQLMLFIP
jgi:hypothetical protein